MPIVALLLSLSFHPHVRTFDPVVAEMLAAGATLLEDRRDEPALIASTHERAALPAMSFESARKRARSDFLEMPGLCLTVAQARRLWMLDASVCTEVRGEFVASRFRSRTRSDSFVRPSLPSSLRVESE